MHTGQKLKREAQIWGKTPVSSNGVASGTNRQVAAPPGHILTQPRGSRFCSGDVETPLDLAQPSPHHALLNQRLPERISADPSAGISLPPEQGEVTILRSTARCQPMAFPAACRARNPPSQTAPHGHEDHGSSRCRTSQEMLSRKHQAQPEQTDPSLL